MKLVRILVGARGCSCKPGVPLHCGLDHGLLRYVGCLIRGCLSPVSVALGRRRGPWSRVVCRGVLLSLGLDGDLQEGGLSSMPRAREWLECSLGSVRYGGTEHVPHGTSARQFPTFVQCPAKLRRGVFGILVPPCPQPPNDGCPLGVAHRVYVASPSPLPVRSRGALTEGVTCLVDLLLVGEGLRVVRTHLVQARLTEVHGLGHAATKRGHVLDRLVCTRLGVELVPLEDLPAAVALPLRKEWVHRVDSHLRLPFW